MDEVSKRLQDSVEKCIKSYATWQEDKKNVAARESLNECLHELRRATAALEIDMIREERQSGSMRPINTPSHRSSVRKDDDYGNGNDDIGNRGDESNGNGGNGGGDRGPRRHGGPRHSGRPRPQRASGGDNPGNE